MRPRRPCYFSGTQTSRTTEPAHDPTEPERTSDRLDPCGPAPRSDLPRARGRRRRRSGAVLRSAMSAGRILIVDDNPNNLALLAGILEEAGYQVRAANAGR